MTLKEELEILRGEPIKVFTGDPMDIPCIETSDPEKLCKHPVVSVQMITYNHEPYIRQAIEGVMMQKTDFEFELVIGEDCSQDKTREICFEYQKKYPDKIRVLWWHENVSKLGGNGRRTGAHCRGEFIALCEGDDYWIDPLKLQKQVDIMRQHPNVGLCFCRARIDKEGISDIRIWNDGCYWKPGYIKGYDFFKRFGFGIPSGGRDSGFLMTATVLLRRGVLEKARSDYELLRWALHLGDVQTWMGVSLLSDLYFLDDVVSVYRQVASGACVSNGIRVVLDARLCRIWYYVMVVSKRPELCIFDAAARLLNDWLYNVNWQVSYDALISRLQKLDTLKPWIFSWQVRPVLVFRHIFGVSRFSRKASGRFVKYIIPLFPRSNFPTREIRGGV